MARKSNGRGSDPSTADASAHEDVEMQDQDDKMNGFKKFGVSKTRICTRNAHPRATSNDACWMLVKDDMKERASKLTSQL
jgi:SWI/SNF-related matrix-associated actin-dependent regulator of chromatin subfamily A member 5